MSGARRPGATGGRAQTQRIASGARANPYGRPSTVAAAGGPQLSIRGAGGPTWIVVSNLLRGTTEADIQETFRQFGNIEAVRVFSEKNNALSFEIAFTHASSAQGAIEKLHGVLADGRTLAVRKRDGTPSSSAASASAKFPLNVPTGPRAQQAVGGGSAKGQAAAKATNGAAGGTLQSRLLTAAELKVLAKKQEKAKKAKVGLNQASPASLALAQRIGSLPLAMRLAEGDKKAAGGGGSTGGSGAGASVKSQKRKRAKAAAAAKAKTASGGMQLD